MQSSGGATTVKVQWLNETGEAGHPYDVAVTQSDGSVKHCEVKTRLVDQGAEPALTWFISAQEMQQAMREEQQYFLCCISLFKSGGTTGRVVGYKCSLVGFNGGLLRTIACKEAMLYIKMHKSDMEVGNRM